MNKLFKIILGVNRESAKSQGFFDGRFSTRSVPNKKKLLHKKLRKDKNFSLKY